MALTKAVTTKQGFLADTAYHRVEQPTLPSNTLLQFIVCSYRSLSDTVSFNVDSYSCAYDILGANPVAQAYAHLKALPEFADAVDV